jgi:hypothetical protein
LLIIDGVKYKPHFPRDEKELEEMVKEHFADIFGEDSLYFDIKPELRSRAGIGSKPDGLAVVFGEPFLHVVEIERAEHGVHDHVVTQISKFNTALKKSSETRRKIADAIYDEIRSDPFKELLVKSKVKFDVYKFLTEIVSAKPKIVIVIDEILDELKDAVDELPLESKIVEFKTFEREGVGLGVHAHLLSGEAVGEEEKERKTGAELADRHIKRLEFWRQLLAKSKTRMNLFARRSPGKDHWISAGAGRSGLAYGYVVLMNSVLIEFYIDTGDKNKNKKIFDDLFKKKQQIESDYGEALEWQRLNDKRASRISKVVEQKGLKSEDDWPVLQDKMIDAMIRFEKALSKHVKTLT